MCFGCILVLAIRCCARFTSSGASAAAKGGVRGVQGPCRAQGRDFRVPLQVVGRSQRRSAVPRPAAYAVQHQRPPLAVRCRHARKDLDTPFTRDRHPNSLAFALTPLSPLLCTFGLLACTFPAVGRLSISPSSSPRLPVSPPPHLPGWLTRAYFPCHRPSPGLPVSGLPRLPGWLPRACFPGGRPSLPRSRWSPGGARPCTPAVATWSTFQGAPLP